MQFPFLAEIAPCISGLESSTGAVGVTFHPYLFLQNVPNHADFELECLPHAYLFRLSLFINK